MKKILLAPISNAGPEHQAHVGQHVEVMPELRYESETGHLRFAIRADDGWSSWAYAMELA